MNRAQRRRDVRYYERREKEFDDIIGDFRSWKEGRVEGSVPRTNVISTSDRVLTSGLLFSLSVKEITRHPRPSRTSPNSGAAQDPFICAAVRRVHEDTTTHSQNSGRNSEGEGATGCETRRGEERVRARQTNPSNDATPTVLYRKSSPPAASSIRRGRERQRDEVLRDLDWLTDGRTD